MDQNWRTLQGAYAPDRRFVCTHHMAALF